MRALWLGLVMVSVACSRFPIGAGGDLPTIVPTTSVAPASYDLTVQISCFCSGLKYRVTVVDGDPRAIKVVSGVSRQWSRKYRPMTSEEVDLLIARFAASADNVDVEGWPGRKGRISIDQDANAIDDELYYKVTVEPIA